MEELNEKVEKEKLEKRRKQLLPTFMTIGQ
jgi:hypothetical protein